MVSSWYSCGIKSKFSEKKLISKPPSLLNDNQGLALPNGSGSLANITYTADGSKAMPKEYVEVFGGGRSAQIDDWKEVVLYSGDTNAKRVKLGVQDKDQQHMIAAWLEGLRSGQPCVDYECLMTTSMATVMAVESLGIGMPLAVDMSVLNERS